MSKRNAPIVKILLVDVIGPYCRGAHKLDRTLVQQRGLDRRHASDEENVGILDDPGVNPPPWKPVDRSERPKGLLDTWYVFISNNSERWHNKSSIIP